MFSNSTDQFKLQQLSKGELIEILLKQGHKYSYSGLSDEWSVYKEVFEESSDALFLTDPEDHKILQCNKKALRIFELTSKNELIGTFGAVFRVNGVSGQLIPDTDENNVEVKYVSTSGKVFWGLKKVTQIRINNRCYRLVRITDITFQKLQEEEKRRSDQLYKSIIDTQKEMICRFKPDTTLTYVNDVYARSLGKSKEDLIGKKFLTLIPEEERSFMLNRLRKVARNGKPITTELMIKLDKSRQAWHMWTDTPVFDEQGQLIEFQGIGIDITERVTTEKRLWESEERFRTLVMAAPVGIFITDKKGNCNWVNPQLESMFNISFQRALGKGLYQVLHRESRRELYALLKDTASTFTAPCRLECRFQYKDEIRWAAISFCSLNNESNEVTGYVGVVEDFTERKSYENELLKTKGELEAALVSKDEFLSVMSHEIRTPLNAIIGFSHLLEDVDNQDEREEIVDTLKFSSSNLLALVNDILDYSKIKAGKLKAEHIPFEIKVLVNNTLKMFRQQAVDKGVTLNSQVDPKVPDSIMGDPTRIGQILNNLIGNAIKFTPEGTVNLNVCKLNDSTLLFEIEDSGIGMNAEEQKLVFEAFSQANASTNRRFGGTGLGLTITKKLVELLSGDIQLKSRVGKGSTFSVYLPLQPTNKAAQRKDLPNETDALKGLSILCVEDIVPNQLLIKSFGKRWEADIDIAANGEEALERIAKNTSYDIVLMDIMMPGMDGYQVAQEIRKKKGSYYQNLPIIALTASVNNRENAKYKESGMNAFVEKPINPTKLYNTIFEHSSKNSLQTRETKPNHRAEKNMFSLLREYHEKNPLDYLELLESSERFLRKYHQQLYKALEKQDLKRFKELCHKIMNIVVLHDDRQFIELIKKYLNRASEHQVLEGSNEEIEKAFGDMYERLDQLASKSKSLLN